MTTEQALRSFSSPVLAERLTEKTGKPAHEVMGDLTLLELQGKARQAGGRWEATRPSGPRKVKGGTVRAKGERRSVKPTVKPVHHRAAYPIEVVSIRWKDPVTGRFTRAPQHAQRPLQLRVRKARTTDDLVVTRIHRKDEASGLMVPHRYSVRYPEARRAHKQGELTAADLRELEQELGRHLMTREGQQLLDAAKQVSHAQEMGAAHRSDKARRGAQTRARNKKLGINEKRRSGDAIRTDLLKVEHAITENLRRQNAARSAKTRQQHVDAMKRLSVRKGRLLSEAKRAS